MKKTISVFISLIMAFSVLSFAQTASASDYCFSLKVEGTQLNSIAGDAVNKVNKTRKADGLDNVTVDAELEEFAQDRAAEIMLGGEKGENEDGVYELCADSTPMSFIFPEYGTGIFTVYGRNNDLDSGALYSYLNALYEGENAKNIKSVGVAAFTMNDVSVYYAIYSLSEPNAEYTDFNDASYSRTVRVHYKYVTYFKYYITAVKKKYFKLSIKGKVSGLYKNYVSIPNSQLIYKSSKPTVFKTKGDKGYIKKTGKYSLTLYDKTSVALCKFEDLSVTINQTPPTLYVTSSKSYLSAQWKKYNDCTGYQLQYSLKKNMKGKKTVRVKGPNKNYYKKKLKKNKKYYVRVRAYIYQGDGEYVYSKWSKIKTVKIK